MESQQKQAWITSLRLLAATPKTRRELSGKLLDKGYAESVVKETLDALEKQGILNDLAYAKNLSARFTYGKPSGRRRISFEMKRRGVPPRIREEILAGISAEDEAKRAREIALPKWTRWESLPAEKRKKRLYDFLTRRGFDYQLTRETVEQLEM